VREASKWSKLASQGEPICLIPPLDDLMRRHPRHTLEIWWVCPRVPTSANAASAENSLALSPFVFKFIERNLSQGNMVITS